MRQEVVAEILEVLSEKREQLLVAWREKIEEAWSKLNLEEAVTPSVFTHTLTELGSFFDAYLDDLRHGGSAHSERFVVGLVGRKMHEGCSLVLLELINSAFADVVRSLIQQRFPDSFDARARYMESVAELVSRNDLRMAHEYETLLAKLNTQVFERQCELERQNALMQDFFKAATHQFQAPLWSILGFANKLMGRYTEGHDTAALHALARIQSNVNEMHLLIQGFARLMQVSPLDCSRIHLSLERVVRSALVQVRKSLGDEYEVSVERPLPNVLGDYKQMEAVFCELLRNAILYVPPERRPNVRVFARPVEEEGVCAVCISDNGIGIPPEYAHLVWAPLERLNDMRVEGLGLGLTYVRRVVDVHGGRVRIAPQEGEGTCMELILPISKERDTAGVREVGAAAR